MKTSLSIFKIIIFLLVSGAPIHAAHHNGNQEQEYEQVRKIALKDPSVRAAFEKANDKLNDRIVEIDPSLKAVVERKTGRATVKKSTYPLTPTYSSTHIVVRGETLTSIAMKYKISVVRLEKANSISNNRKLSVGQKLVIPHAHTTEAESHASDNWWTKVKDAF